MYNFVYFMMADSAETKSSESSGTTAQTRISEIVSCNITDRKLDENNYLQWKRLIKIYVVGREKTSYLLADFFSLVTDDWTLDDNVLLY